MLGDAGTIDRFGLAFQYHITRYIYKRMDKNNRKLQILYKCIQANTRALWQHNYAAHTANKKYSSPNR